MKRTIAVILSLVALSIGVQSQTIDRREIRFPDIDRYKTLKCDFHIHTVFSNGLVWPTVRVQEAWMEGLDAIAFTDHLEYHTFDKDVVYDDNRATEVAQPMADLYGMILIRGTEITRQKPFGHFNAIFTTDNNAIRVSDSIQSIAIANRQHAFVSWNHPGENSGNWVDVQEKLFKQGQFQGIEVANHNSYYSVAQQWCMDKKLTMMGTSDVHNPITFDYDFAKGEHRTMTLVFAKEKSSEGIRDALLNRRTAVYWKNVLIGEEEFLSPIYKQSVELPSVTMQFKKNQRNKAFIFFKNNSDFPFELTLKNEAKELSIPKKVILKGNITAVAIEFNTTVAGVKTITIPFEVTNLLVQPNKGMHSEFNLKINVQ